MIKKLLLPFVVIVGFVGFIMYGRIKGAPRASVPATSASLMPTSAFVPVTTPTTSSTTTSSTAGSASTSAGQYKDGTYTGSVADAYYGNVQVQAVITNGAIADVQFLQYPSDNGNSANISQRSMPLLKAEAISTQSATVDIISGATQTSQAFQQSLTAALNQAS
jgi:uncharacterized protein with FMN-binding domain